MIVEMLANNGHLFFQRGDNRRRPSFAARHPAYVRRIDAELVRDAIVETTKNCKRRKARCVTIAVVTFHDAAPFAMALARTVYSLTRMLAQVSYFLYSL